MNEVESLNHTRWECKYHVVFIPKCRRKLLFGEIRRELGGCSAELPPSEWSIDYDSLDQGRDDECLRRSTSPRKSSGICVR